MVTVSFHPISYFIFKAIKYNKFSNNDNRNQFIKFTDDAPGFVGCIVKM